MTPTATGTQAAGHAYLVVAHGLQPEPRDATSAWDVVIRRIGFVLVLNWCGRQFDWQAGCVCGWPNVRALVIPLPPSAAHAPSALMSMSDGSRRLLTISVRCINNGMNRLKYFSSSCRRSATSRRWIRVYSSCRPGMEAKQARPHADIHGHGENTPTQRT